MHAGNTDWVGANGKTISERFAPKNPIRLEQDVAVDYGKGWWAAMIVVFGISCVVIPFFH